MLTMFVMVGARIGRHSLRREVGSGSRSHCLLAADLTRVTTSSTVAGLKVAKLAGGCDGSGVCGNVVVAGIADWSRTILSEKKDEND